MFGLKEVSLPGAMEKVFTAPIRVAFIQLYTELYHRVPLQFLTPGRAPKGKIFKAYFSVYIYICMFTSTGLVRSCSINIWTKWTTKVPWVDECADKRPSAQTLALD